MIKLALVLSLARALLVPLALFNLVSRGEALTPSVGGSSGGASYTGPCDVIAGGCGEAYSVDRAATSAYSGARSPYDDFDPRKYPVDFQGWGSDAPLLGESIQLVRPQRICEVGSWKGRSAINMANAAKALGLHTEIVCVDTWLGSPEHWLRQEPEWYSSLAIRHGMPQLYYTFLANVVRAGVSDVITPFPNTSEGAAAVFSALGIRFELAYVDAAHEYEPAKRDIALYYDLLAEEGLLIGDDYLHWPGVTQAADDFAQERRLPLIGARGKFVIPKGRRYADIKLAAGSA